MEGDKRGGSAPARGLAAALAAGFCALVACSPIERSYGYVPADDQLAEIEVGRDTRDSVAEKIGRPVNSSVSGDGSWYYVSSLQRTVGPRQPQIVQRDIVAVRFDEGGAVENIERFDVSDGRVIQLTARVTDSSVSELSIIRQIFGNIGTPTGSDIAAQTGQGL